MDTDVSLPSLQNDIIDIPHNIISIIQDNYTPSEKYNTIKSNSLQIESKVNHSNKKLEPHQRFAILKSKLINSKWTPPIRNHFTQNADTLINNNDESINTNINENGNTLQQVENSVTFLNYDTNTTEMQDKISSNHHADEPKLLDTQHGNSNNVENKINIDTNSAVISSVLNTIETTYNNEIHKVENDNYPVNANEISKNICKSQNGTISCNSKYINEFVDDDSSTTGVTKNFYHNKSYNKVTNIEDMVKTTMDHIEQIANKSANVNETTEYITTNDGINIHNYCENTATDKEKQKLVESEATDNTLLQDSEHSKSEFFQQYTNDTRCRSEYFINDHNINFEMNGDKYKRVKSDIYDKNHEQKVPFQNLHNNNNASVNASNKICRNNSPVGLRSEHNIKYSNMLFKSNEPLDINSSSDEFERNISSSNITKLSSDMTSHLSVQLLQCITSNAHENETENSKFLKKFEKNKSSDIRTLTSNTYNLSMQRSCNVDEEARPIKKFKRSSEEEKNISDTASLTANTLDISEHLLQYITSNNDGKKREGNFDNNICKGINIESQINKLPVKEKDILSLHKTEESCQTNYLKKPENENIIQSITNCSNEATENFTQRGTLQSNCKNVDSCITQANKYFKGTFSTSKYNSLSLSDQSKKDNVIAFQHTSPESEHNNSSTMEQKYANKVIPKSDSSVLPCNVIHSVREYISSKNNAKDTHMNRNSNDPIIPDASYNFSLPTIEQIANTTPKCTLTTINLKNMDIFESSDDDSPTLLNDISEETYLSISTNMAEQNKITQKYSHINSNYLTPHQTKPDDTRANNDCVIKNVLPREVTFKTEPNLSDNDSYDKDFDEELPNSAFLQIDESIENTTVNERSHGTSSCTIYTPKISHLTTVSTPYSVKQKLQNILQNIVDINTMINKMRNDSWQKRKSLTKEDQQLIPLVNKNVPITMMQQQQHSTPANRRLPETQPTLLTNSRKMDKKKDNIYLREYYNHTPKSSFQHENVTNNDKVSSNIKSNWQLSNTVLPNNYLPKRNYPPFK